MAVTWLHLSPDLKFRRDEQGRIVMRMGGEQSYIAPAKWVALVAGLSRDGGTPDSIKVATGLHGGAS